MTNGEGSYNTRLGLAPHLCGDAVRVDSDAVFAPEGWRNMADKEYRIPLPGEWFLFNRSRILTVSARRTPNFLSQLLNAQTGVI
jgi:hypothetical protein